MLNSSGSGNDHRRLWQRWTRRLVCLISHRDKVAWVCRDSRQGHVRHLYQKLDEWLTRNWRVQKLEHDLKTIVNSEQTCGCCGYSTHLEIGPIEEYQRLCDMSYTLGAMQGNGVPQKNGVYKACGSEGENNMGKLTMQLAQFMTNECGWMLQVCDSDNLGVNGEIREQQLKFKAPHPLNLIAPLIMIELRQAGLHWGEWRGYVVVNGANTKGIHTKLDSFLRSKWNSSRIQADPDYCDLKFSTGAFQSRGMQGENNMGLRTMQLVDFMVKECAWTLVTCSGGKYSRSGADQYFSSRNEHQLVFRNDEFVQHGADHIMVEFRTVGGYIEIYGLHDADDLKPHLINYLVQQWGCKEYTQHMWNQGANFCDLKYTCPAGFYYKEGVTKNLGRRTLQLADFLGTHGWALLLYNGGRSVAPHREQQVKFTRAKSVEKAVAPLLMIELRTQPTSDHPARWNCFIEVCGRDTNNVYGALHQFLTNHMNAVFVQQAAPYCDLVYTCNNIRLKPSSTAEGAPWCDHPMFMNGESNIGKWTMRICDFMVDHLGEWDLIVCDSNNLEWNFGSSDNESFVTAREMQLVFRHRPGGRAVFMSADNVKPLGRPPLHPPTYWTDFGCITGGVGHKLIPGTQEELGWMQEILDKTFKQKVTRDRKDGQPLADRFVAVQCIRSEHPALWDKFAEHRKKVEQSCRGDPSASSKFTVPKTSACEALAGRCVHAEFGNPANQAYLLHGTNPTAAVEILDSSFHVDFAGKSAGTMFGAGVYLAESSTKADEYARDDVGGEYDGLYAVLVCRVLLGRSFVTEQPGDCVQQVQSGDFESILGDREKAVDTFREFIFFHEAAIYPEYAVFYRREKDGTILPPPAREDPPQMETMESPALLQLR
ncbi:poly(ADP-ribose) polymerase family protein [Amphidinium carterae]